MSAGQERHEGLLTIDEVAEHLKITRDGVIYLCRLRRLPFALISGKRRFRRVDLDHYIERNIVDAVERPRR